MSGNTQLSRRLWEYFHSWRLEWALPASDATRGYLRWYMNDMLVYGITGKSLADKVKGSMVSLAWPRVTPRVAPRVSCCSCVCARQTRGYAHGSHRLGAPRQIPSEPQYVILNTAMSSSWGFPSCPRGCGCDCFDCGDPGGRLGPCGCGIAEGFCESLPAHFLVDHVRIWQRSDDKHQKVSSEKQK